MFATFDKLLFPRINVSLNGEIKPGDYELFENQWMECYDYDISKGKFTFVINTLKFKAYTSNLRHSYLLSKFIGSIKEKRKTEKKYDRLERSIIIVNNTLVRYLFQTIFLVQTPLAPIYIVQSQEKANELYYNFINNIENDYSGVSVIKV